MLLQDQNYTRWLTEEIVNVNKSVKHKDDVVTTTWKDGPYLLVVKIKSNKPEVKWNLTGKLKETKHIHVIRSAQGQAVSACSDADVRAFARLDGFVCSLYL